MTTREKAWRNSMLALGRECNFAYWATYVDGDEGISSPSLTAGSNVHRAIAECLRDLLLQWGRTRASAEWRMGPSLPQPR